MKIVYLCPMLFVFQLLKCKCYIYVSITVYWDRGEY